MSKRQVSRDEETKSLVAMYMWIYFVKVAFGIVLFAGGIAIGIVAHQWYLTW